eukprot:4754721-Pyramimonas_sp.AAC.1
MQALTSQDDDEIRACLSVLRSTTASRWFMHESFDKDRRRNSCINVTAGPPQRARAGAGGAARGAQR